MKTPRSVGWAPAQLDRWLWTSAAGLLEPDEEAALAAYAAAHPEARARLEEIRGCFDTLAGRAGPSLEDARRRALGAAGSEAGEALAAIRRKLFDGLEQWRAELEAGLAAVVVCLRGGLYAAAQQAGWTVSEGAGRRLILKAGDEEASAAGSGPNRQEITASNGTRVTLVMVSDERIDVLVAPPEPARASTARLFQVASEGGRLTRVPVAIAQVERGRAEFQRCPAGVLQIEMAGLEPILIGVGPAPARVQRRT